MNNTCEVCKSTIDEQWSSLQNEVKNMFKEEITNQKTAAFVSRCIYCYKQYLEIVEKDEHNWYLKVMEIIKKRFEG